MPRGDGTGPDGLGPMTGRGAGYCAGYDAPGYMNPGVGGGGRGWGRGRGRHLYGWGYGARARRAWFGGRWAAPYAYPPPPAAAGPAPYAPVTRDDELAYLKDEAKGLEDALENIRKRITELSSQSEE